MVISALMIAVLAGLAAGGASSFKRGILAMFLLVALLISRELAGAAANSTRSFKSRNFARAVMGVLTIPVVPLLFVLGFIVAVNLISILN